MAWSACIILVLKYCEFVGQHFHCTWIIKKAVNDTLWKKRILVIIPWLVMPLSLNLIQCTCKTLPPVKQLLNSPWVSTSLPHLSWRLFSIHYYCYDYWEKAIRIMWKPVLTCVWWILFSRMSIARSNINASLNSKINLIVLIT